MNDVVRDLQFIQNIRRCHDEFCAILNELICPLTGGVEDVAGYSKNIAPLFGSKFGSKFDYTAMRAPANPSSFGN